MTFAKYGNAVLGHREPMVYPKSTQELDYEVELAVVIGRRGKYMVRDRAPDHVGGYTIFNDVSARELQHADKQVMRGKAGDVIATGTPPGVGIHGKPPLLLKPGDTVTMTIERLGRPENPIVAEST